MALPQAQAQRRGKTPSTSLADRRASRVAGRVLDTTEAAQIRAAIIRAMTPMIGKEICVVYQSTPSGLTEQATIDGVRQPQGDERVAWVAPGDGYSVAP
jgi:hypothetical protein